MTNFHNFALKIETKVFKPTMKTRIVNDQS